jgi:hypothetical protein
LLVQELAATGFNGTKIDTAANPPTFTANQSLSLIEYEVSNCFIPVFINGTIATTVSSIVGSLDTSE